MRALFVALAAAVAAIVVAAALWPRVVDGETVQAELRRLAREATGHEVTVRGRVGINLLPRPRLSLARVVVGNPLAAEGPLLAEADRVDLEVSPLAFVAGRVEVRSVRLIRPRLTFAADASPAGLLPALASTLASPGLAALESVGIVDGRVDVAGGQPPRPQPPPPQQQQQQQQSPLPRRAGPGPAIAHLEAIDGTLRRDTLLGRVAVSLTASARGVPLSLEAEVAEAAIAAASEAASAPSGVRFELVHGASGHTARLDFRGFGAFGGPDGPSLRGAFELEATEPAALHRLVGLVHGGPGTDAQRLPRTAPLLFEGQAELAGRTLRLDEVACRLGGNALNASLELAWGEAVPRLTVKAEGTEFVLDADTAEDARLLLASTPWSDIPLAGRAELQLGAVRWDGQLIRQLRFEASLPGGGGGGGDGGAGGGESGASVPVVEGGSGGGVRIERLTATLPGSTDLSVTGVLRRGNGRGRGRDTGPALAGSVSVAAEDARAFLGAFGVDLTALPDGSVQTLALSSELAASPASVTLRGFELRLDGSRVTGSAALVPGGPRSRLALSAWADRLNLAAYLPRPGGASTPRAALLLERLTALDAAVDLAVDRVSLGDLRGEGVYLRASVERGLLRLAELSVRDLAEARLRVTGTGDLPVASFQLAGELEAARPARLLRALGMGEPPPTVTRFAPVRITGTARGTREATEVELGLAATGLSARLGAAVGPWFDLSTGDLELGAEAGRLGDTLRNLGLASPEAATDRALERPLRLAARLRRAGDSLALSFEGDAPPSRVEGRLGLRLGGDDGPVKVTGTVDGPAVDRELLLAAAAVALPGAGPTGPAAPVSPGVWLGRLPDVPLSLDGLRGLDLDLRLSAAVRDEHDDSANPGPEAMPAPVPGTRTEAHLRAGPEHFSLDNLRTPLAGGELAGVLTVDAEAGGAAVVGIDIGLDDVRAEELLPLLGVAAGPGGSRLAGGLDLGLRLSGSGRDLPGLVGSLEGEGDLHLRDGRLDAAAPAPPPTSADAAVAQGGEPLRLDGGLAVSRGILASEAPGLEVAGAGASGTADLRLDLLAWMAELGLELRGPGPAYVPPLVRRFLGPPDRLREVSVWAATPAAVPPAAPPAPVEGDDAGGPASPTVPASAPDAPTRRTPPT